MLMYLLRDRFLFILDFIFWLPDLEAGRIYLFIYLYICRKASIHVSIQLCNYLEADSHLLIYLFRCRRETFTDIHMYLCAGLHLFLYLSVCILI